MFYIPVVTARIFVCFLLLFTVHRLFFILYHFKACSQKGIGLMLRTFYEALPLDISTACYVTGISLVFVILQYILNRKIIFTIHKIVLGLFVFLFTVIAIADILVYREMNVKIHFKLLYHLQHPQEVFQSVSTVLFILGWVIIIGFSWLATKLLFRFAFRTPVPAEKPLRKGGIALASFLLLAFLIFTGMRGGWQQIPINESRVYFTQYHVLDDAAVNPAWTLLHSYLENRKAGNTNPYVFMSPPAADSLVNQLYQTADSSFGQFLTTDRPNIVYVILESWTADVVGVCGGQKGITPRFDSLSRDGMLFSNFYASGQMSHHGIPAILSSYPAQPITAIIQNSNKYPHIPCVNRVLAPQGYNSSFYFGGQLIYGNIRGYIYYNQFDEIKEQSDFNAPGKMKGKLGIHDEFMFNTLLDKLNSKKQPFFSSLFTISTHSPYTIPRADMVDYGGEFKPFFNSVYYSDSCIGDFLEKAKQLPWYKNTLFVFVADHSHVSPKGNPNSSPEHNHVPLLFYGDVIDSAWRGKNFTHPTSQTDINATILGQMKIPHKQFTWSKSLLDTTNAFAFYTFYNGYGFVTPKGVLVWDKKAGGKYTRSSIPANDTNNYRLKGEAYLQKLFQEYLDF